MVEESDDVFWDLISVFGTSVTRKNYCLEKVFRFGALFLLDTESENHRSAPPRIPGFLKTASHPTLRV